MPESVEVQIADAVVAELNDPARGWSQSFTASREWHPVWSASELSSLKVAVVALTLDAQHLDRARVQREYGVVVNFQKMVDVSSKATIDALSRLAEEVHNFFLDAHRLNTLSTYKVMGAQRPELYDLARLYTEQTWETLLVLTVRGWA